jgi:phage tail sheath gpL-like
MTVSFNNIPINLRTPGQYAGFDNSRAVSGVAEMPNRALCVGQVKTTGTGTKAIETLVSIPSGAAAEEYFGVGSQIAEMCKAFKLSNPYTELWAIALEDDGAGVAATGTVTITGTASEDGILDIYIGGHHLSVPVADEDTETEVGDALDAASDADDSIPAFGVNVAGVVTFTSRWLGVNANDIDIRENYQQTQKTPAGLTVAIVGMASGANDPDYSAAIAVIGGEWFNTFMIGTNDATELALFEAELEAKWGPLVQKDGQCYAAKGDTQANLTTYGNARNSQFMTVMGYYDSPTPPWLWATIVGSVDAYQNGIDPSRPRQSLYLRGILPPPEANRFTQIERNILLYDGISTFVVDQSGRCNIERLITTYQTNGLGVPDPSYLDITTMRTLAYLRYTMNAWIGQKFPRHKLADDGTEFGEGAAVVTPSVIRSELLAWFKFMENAAHVEGFEQFKTDLIVERDVSDLNRVNALVPPDLINGFRVLASQIQFLG